MIGLSVDAAVMASATSVTGFFYTGIWPVLDACALLREGWGGTGGLSSDEVTADASAVTD